jgi:3',5'-cyclic AMP phosphodiesterase CpdA
MRDRRIVNALVDHLRQLHRDLTIVSGGCLGSADEFAEDAARTRGLHTTIFYPDHSAPKKFKAEPFFKRNREIAEESDVIYALVHATRTGGTENTIRHALDLKKPVYLVDGNGNVYLSNDGDFPKCDPVARLLG